MSEPVTFQALLHLKSSKRKETVKSGVKTRDMHEKRFDGEIGRLRAPERVERLEIERVVGYCLEATDFKNVLDVGTGSGLFAEAFWRRGLEVSGIDANPEMIPAARQFVPKGSFREATAEALPYPDASFDLVFLGLVLHESDEPIQALQEAWRVTRNRVCILEWPYRDQEFGPPMADRIKPEEMTGLIHEAGFSKWESQALSNTAIYRLTK
jgi:SAM-dependent methyltransferase